MHRENYSLFIINYLRIAKINNQQSSIIHQKLGIRANGQQPREPWRQLEQQRQQLPCVEPQQQQPRQQQRQYRLPAGCAAQQGQEAEPLIIEQLGIPSAPKGGKNKTRSVSASSSFEKRNAFY